MEEPTYTVVVRVATPVRDLLHAEQARRTLRGDKKPTVAELASELLSTAAKKLNK